MKIGIDFGSTYSTVSKYNENNDTVEALHMEEGAPVSIPSAVSIAKIDGSITCGEAAKSQTGGLAFTVYDGFKMLLVENDPVIIGSRNYNEKYTPKYITTRYLESILQGVMRRFGKNKGAGEEYDDIIICMPEIWSKNLSTLDGRNILTDILKKEISGVNVNNVNVVTEPEAASAYFAHNYEKETNIPFNGHLLLIDYGGGTLDITLTEVMSDGDGKMEIGYREGCGVGENHPDSMGNISIGNAGMAYMQGVIVRALKDCGVERPDCNEPAFKKAVFMFEKNLKAIDGIKKIEDTFSEFGDYKDFEEILDEEPMIFTFVEYRDKIVIITYQHLFTAYRDIIQDVLYKEVYDINRKVQEHIKADPCLPESGNRDDFKIALVGGFGSFYLVKKQLSDIYNITSYSKNDKRIKNLRTDKSEQAISLGAALIASGRVILQKTAKFSIGLLTRRSTDAKKNVYYGITYHQQLVPDKPYFICYHGSEDDSPSNRIIYTNLRNNMNQFAIGFSDDPKRYSKIPLKNEILHKLDPLPVYELCNVGFSIGENNVVSIHIAPCFSSGENDKGMVIPLDSYANMLDLNAAEEEYIDEV